MEAGRLELVAHDLGGLELHRRAPAGLGHHAAALLVVLLLAAVAVPVRRPGVGGRGHAHAAQRAGRDGGGALVEVARPARCAV